MICKSSSLFNKVVKMKEFILFSFSVTQLEQLGKRFLRLYTSCRETRWNTNLDRGSKVIFCIWTRHERRIVLFGKQLVFLKRSLAPSQHNIVPSGPPCSPLHPVYPALPLSASGYLPHTGTISGTCEGRQVNCALTGQPCLYSALFPPSFLPLTLFP